MREAPPSSSAPRSGFDRLSVARQLPGSAQHEEMLVPLGYYVQSESIHQGLTDLFNWLNSLPLETLADLPVWLTYTPELRNLTSFPGFITDYASSPRITWPKLEPRDIRRPAVHHDAGYRLILHLRKQGLITRRKFRHLRRLFDRLFQEAMRHLEPPLPAWKRAAAYRFVRLLGGFTRPKTYEHLRPDPA